MAATGGWTPEIKEGTQWTREITEECSRRIHGTTEVVRQARWTRAITAECSRQTIAACNQTHETTEVHLEEWILTILVIIQSTRTSHHMVTGWTLESIRAWTLGVTLG